MNSIARATHLGFSRKDHLLKHLNQSKHHRHMDDASRQIAVEAIVESSGPISKTIRQTRLFSDKNGPYFRYEQVEDADPPPVFDSINGSTSQIGTRDPAIDDQSPYNLARSQEPITGTGPTHTAPSSHPLGELDGPTNSDFSWIEELGTDDAETDTPSFYFSPIGADGPTDFHGAATGGLDVAPAGPNSPSSSYPTGTMDAPIYID
ncbi:MAG: hypothetical protein M1827_003219 [Pycnora praestabilis]|nr:MAG: hypothetical protein M1827_003219 [Pycnora praestabilis]